MAVCACGNTMLRGEPWCKRCWAAWSTWFMRARGKWINLATGLSYNAGECDGGDDGPCEACHKQHMLQELADEAENFATRLR